MKKQWLVCVVVLTLAASGCAKKAPMIDLAAEAPHVVLFQTAQTPTEVRAAIVAALQARGWTTDGETAEAITARLDHKGSSARIELSYAADRVTMRGLEAELQQRQYQKWLANLEASIRDALQKPAPVAAPAAPAGATPPPTLAVFQSTQTVASAKSALQRALSQHSWVIEEELPGASLIARLNHRKGLVRVRLDYDVNQVSISYVTSSELDIDKSGRSADYEKWMRNLVAAIVGSTGTASAPAPAPAPAPAAAVPPPTIAVYGATQALDKARAALQRALAQHNWVIEDSKPEALVARLAHRKGLVRVRIESTDQQATITYVDSQGLALDASGRSADYERWMRNLVDAVVGATQR